MDRADRLSNFGGSYASLADDGSSSCYLTIDKTQTFQCTHTHLIRTC